MRQEAKKEIIMYGFKHAFAGMGWETLIPTLNYILFIKITAVQ